jgi:NADH:ubiquinone oxidoreductase subunit 4 (subunit M)
VECWTNRANKKEKERKTAKWKGHQFHILTELYIIWDFASSTAFLSVNRIVFCLFLFYKCDIFPMYLNKGLWGCTSITSKELMSAALSCPVLRMF